MRFLSLCLLLTAVVSGPAQSRSSFVPRSGVAPCAMEIGHVDASAVLCGATHPLPDGCRIAIFEDVDRDGEVSADDHELLPCEHSGSELDSTALSTNGLARLNAAGCFLHNVTVELAQGSALYFRVYDGRDPASASGFWQSPFYEPLPGFQQVSFGGEQWTWHPGKRLPQPAGHPESGARPLAPDLTQPGRLLSFPNPFNSTTSIAFKLDQPSLVQIRVFDLNGRTVQTLMDRELGAGSHRVNFASDGLPSGSYIVAMNSHNKPALTTRVMLVK